MALPPMIPPSGPAGGNPLAAGAGTLPGQPPFGSSPVQMPTPDRGLQSAALAQVSWAVRILEKALPLLGAGSNPGKDVLKALQSLTKHVPPGSTMPGAENSVLQQMMMQGKQEQPMNQVLQAMGQGGAPGGGMGMPQPQTPTGM